MVRHLGRNAILTIVAAATTLGWAGCADAALLDWLFPRRRQAQRQYYMLSPGTAATAVAAPTARYTTNFPGWGPSTQPYAWYAPQTQYRTMWAPVPTTSFRPVGTNGLQPCTALSWQSRRVPVIAYQPTLTPSVPAAPASPCGCAAPTACGPGTCYYGNAVSYAAPTAAPSAAATSAWTPVAPSNSGCTSCGYSSGESFSPTVPGNYASTTPSSSSSSATEWTPVPADSTSGGSQWQPYAADTTDTTPQGEATPWQPVPSSGGTVPSSGGEPSPADRQPALKPQIDGADPTSDAGRVERDRYHDDSGSSTRTGYRYYPPKTDRQNAHQLVPFQRPIPDPDRIDDGWDFDDKMKRGAPQPRTANASDRWEAIPIGTYSPQPEMVRGRRPILDGPDRSLPYRDEGGWRSSVR